MDTAYYAGSSEAVAVSLATGSGTAGDAAGDTLIGIENLVGSDHADALHGNNGANFLDGEGGDDELDGGAGDDDLRGGPGADTLIGGPGADRLDGGGDGDTAFYAGAPAAVTVNLETGTGTQGEAAGDTLFAINNLVGSDYDDTLIGDAGANALAGGAGADTLDGGDGVDTAVYAGATAAVEVSLASGTGTQGEADGDTLTGIENLVGSRHDDRLAGNTGANHLAGSGGKDVLYGDAGNDTLAGGAGDDALLGGPGADSLVGGEGVDTALYSGAAGAVSVNLKTGAGTQGEADGDTFTGIENLHGSDHGDTFIASDGANHLVGLDGDDRLAGEAGDDRLDGDAGDDGLVGGSGADTLNGGAGNDSLAAVWVRVGWRRGLLCGCHRGCGCQSCRHRARKERPPGILSMISSTCLAAGTHSPDAADRLYWRTPWTAVR